MKAELRRPRRKKKNGVKDKGGPFYICEKIKKLKKKKVKNYFYANRNHNLKDKIFLQIDFIPSTYKNDIFSLNI
jgi:hypothetical protein